MLLCPVTSGRRRGLHMVLNGPWDLVRLLSSLTVFYSPPLWLAILKQQMLEEIFVSFFRTGWERRYHLAAYQGRGRFYFWRGEFLDLLIYVLSQLRWRIFYLSDSFFMFTKKVKPITKYCAKCGTLLLGRFLTDLRVHWSYYESLSYRSWAQEEQILSLFLFWWGSNHIDNLPKICKSAVY